MARVAVTGVTGFIGRRVAVELSRRHSLIGLVRRRRPRVPSALAGVDFRSCDLFALEDAERALAGAEVAVYLIHSMSPATRGVQGSFDDLDLLLADNFARACAKSGVRRIVYVGGLIPEAGELSTHLRSRLEVERALGGHGVPVVALRAGLVVGREGSSFQIVERLVRRLPAMICPAWTDTPCQPIAIDDLLRAVVGAVEDPEVKSGAIDVAGPEVLTYREMLERTADQLGKRPYLARFPLFTPGLSRLWVSLVTGAPKDLVAPLVESLAHPMVAKRRSSDPSWARGKVGFDQALAAAFAPAVQVDEVSVEASVAPDAVDRPDSSVLCVQRLPLPAGATAASVADEYLRWLPTATHTLVRVRADGVQRVHFESPLWSAPLLSLRRADEGPSPDCAQLYVEGGALASTQPSGTARLEFRCLGANDCVLAAVQDFVPRLSWKAYAATQAPAHAAVMRAFGRHLEGAGGGIEDFSGPPG